MDIGIIGLPQSGKTTIFNAVTRGNAAVVAYGNKPNIGVAKVPDERLDVLDDLFKPRRRVPAEVTYIDVPAAPEGLGKTRGISGEFLNQLQRVDALLIVARAFEDPSVPHVLDSIDPYRDIETMMYEMTFADLEILDRRLARITEGFKSARAGQRDELVKEQGFLTRLKTELESGTPVRDQTLDADQTRLIEGFQLLTSKPVIIAVNVGEGQLPEIPGIEERLSTTVKGEYIRTAALGGSLEMDLAQMEPEDEAEFRASMEAGEAGLNRMIRLCYDVLGLITFFTVGEDEDRAWTITKGTTAVKGAGRIHTDLERGFIRAEVVAYDDLVKCRTLAEARKQGVLRQEGRNYMVKDGDIMHILFNV
jgi:hypothetical protein